MLTDLADACRATGLTVVETPGWKTRGHGPMSNVQTILCHHTAGPKNGELPSLATVRDGRPDLAGPLAHLMLGRSGTVYVIAAGLCWHAGVVFDNSQANEHAIGIEAEATGVDPWPLVQYDAYARLTCGLAKHYGLPTSRILGHKEVASPRGRKSDPNFDMPAFRSKATNITGTPAAVPAAAKPRHPEEDVMYIKCETTPGGKVLTGILSGSLLIGLGEGGETQSADLAISNGATVQWVVKGTWDALDASSHHVHDNPRPVTVVAPTVKA